MRQFIGFVFYFISITTQAYISDWVVTHNQIEQTPIIVQSLPNQNIIKAFNPSFDIKLNQLSVSTLWKHQIKIPISKLILVGEPSLPFPDIWPIINGLTYPPENLAFAQKYSDYKKQNALRRQIVYLIDGAGHLTGFDLHTSEKAIDLNLYDLLNIEPVVSSNHKHTTPLLTSMDVFYDSQWHTVLVGAFNEFNQDIFCLDITHPSILKPTLAKAQLLWHHQSNEGAYESPVIVRMPDGKWHALIGLAGKNILQFDIKLGHLKEVYEIPRQKQDCEEQAFTSMVAIDSKARQFVDYLYVTTNQGYLWKINLFNQKSMQETQKIYLFFKELQGSIYSLNLSTHPDNAFVVQFLLTDQYQNSYLVNLKDDGKHEYLLRELTQANGKAQDNWCLPIGQMDLKTSQQQFVVRNHRIVMVQDGMVTARDILYGNQVSQAAINLTDAGKQINSLNRLVGLPFVFHTRLKQPDIFIQALQNDNYAWGLLDIESDKLGRQVWRSIMK